FVMVYRVTPLTHLLGRWTVKVPHFAMVNLIAGRRVVPELVQKDFTAERIVAEVNRITQDVADRQEMLTGLREVRARLRGTAIGQEHPAERAAGRILDLVKARTAAGKTKTAANHCAAASFGARFSSYNKVVITQSEAVGDSLNVPCNVAT